MISVGQHKTRNLQTKRSLLIHRNLQKNLGNASIVVSKRGMLSRLIVQRTDWNVEFVRKWIIAQMCHSRRKKVHVSVEVKGYESEESFLQLEEITAISGSGKQLTSSITFVVVHKYKEQLVCQLDTGATCNVISHRSLVQLLQNGDPPLRKSSSQLKLFDDTLIWPVGEITFTVERTLRQPSRPKVPSCQQY